ncbi:MAG: DNA translocase FtsK 4TM domain-containing protein [Deltaproteobacteria bacterium]|nr:DNA translocase FtsK 4TM domain-containing protein [Deltaproteobacteria bacterium]
MAKASTAATREASDRSETKNGRSEIKNDRPDAKNGGKPSRTEADVRQRELRGEWAGLVLFGAGAAFAGALLSHDPRDMAAIAAGQGAEHVANWLGPVGARMADMLLHFLGLGAFLLNALVLALAGATLTGKMRAPRPRVALGALGAALSVMILLHLIAQRWHWKPLGKDAAGLIPGGIAMLLKAMLSTAGTALLATLTLAASLAALTGRTLTTMLVRWVSGKTAPVVSKAVEKAATYTTDAARDGVQSLRNRVGQARETQAPARATAPQRTKTAPYTGPALADLSEVELAAQTAPRPAPPLSVAAAEAAFWGEPGAEISVSAGELLGTAPAGAMADTAVARKSQPLPAVGRPTQPLAALAPLDPTSTAVRMRHPAETDAPPIPEPVRLAEEQLRAPLSAAEKSSTIKMNAVEVSQVLGELKSLSLGEEPELTAAFVMPVVDDRGLAQSAEAAANGDDADVPLLTLNALAEAARDPSGPRIVETEALRHPTAMAPIEAVAQSLAIEGKSWVLPPSTLLADPPSRALKLDEEAQRVLRENAVILESKLAEFGIMGEVADIRPGPVVTTYEYRPAAGVKISKIVNLKDDLTMKLSALRVRVVAPIPGRDVVGIEVPNKERQMVYFREVLERPEFRDSKNPLTMILGKDIEGKPMTMDLAKAPHLLVAGATGTGKSVGINTFISSLLFRCTPDDLKLMLIDPKILELSIYADIPHLLLPVIDEPRKAELALKWACVEMDRRYKMMAAVEVRNLASYKQKIPELRAAAARQRALAGEDMDAVTIEDPPYIVVVIDEFADLIMSAGKEVEVPVARLAQKARAAGIHVILATQRPSTDVITGMIKANFPTRVSFQVASAIDSKVVLNTYGAETLLGRGDMLLVPPGEGNLKRCHGTWISDDEVAHLAKHWREQGTPKYEMDIRHDPEVEGSVGADDAESDALYDDAVQVVVEAGQASVSFLQRKLGVGYGRAARMIDTMAARGIVGPSRGPNKPREILINQI